MRVRLIVVIAALVALAAPAPALASPAQELERAREQFRDGLFVEAIPGLNYLLYPNPRLAQEDDLLEARVLLAVCAFEAGDRDTATTEFTSVLQENISFRLDRLLFSKGVVEFFDGLKKTEKAKADKAAEERRGAEDAALVQAALDAMIVYETRPFYVNFIPFGAGQFQNDHRRKGLFFAATQGVTGAISAGLWLYLVGEFGLPGKVEPERANEALALQEIEIGFGAVCLGLMAWGVIDSLVHYEPTVRRKSDKSMLPSELRKKLDPKATSVRVEPQVFAGGAGMSLTWEY